jgi:hypothetical protein
MDIFGKVAILWHEEGRKTWLFTEIRKHGGRAVQWLGV